MLTSLEGVGDQGVNKCQYSLSTAFEAGLMTEVAAPLARP